MDVVLCVGVGEEMRVYIGRAGNSRKNTFEVQHRLDMQRERKEQQSFSGIFPVQLWYFFQIGYAVGMLRKICVKQESKPKLGIHWACWR